MKTTLATTQMAIIDNGTLYSKKNRRYITAHSNMDESYRHKEEQDHMRGHVYGSLDTKFKNRQNSSMAKEV